MIDMFDEIRNRKNLISNQILKSFVYDIEKSIPIGETRQWKDGNYKKVGPGQWVKVVETKKGVNEKIVAQSGMKKILENERGKHYEVYSKMVEEFDKKWKEQNGNELWKIQLKVKLARDRADNEELKKAYDKYNSFAKELNEELSEVLNLKSLREKEEREKIAGKKEISIDDDYYKNNRQSIHKLFSEVAKIPEYVGASKALGEEVTVDNYWLSTNATFKTVYEYKPEDSYTEDKTYIDPVQIKWKEMIDSGKYEFTQSPKSSSQYLIDRKTGDVYRKADHWGRCASCVWDDDFKKSSYGIAVCNVKDFKRNDYSTYHNPERKSAELSSCYVILDTIKTMLNDNKVYFDKEVMTSMKNIISKVDERLKWYANFASEKAEIEEYRKKYKELFAI